MRIPEAQIAQIVDRLEIVDVVAEYTALRPRGGRHWGLCPFHTEKTPSFTVSPDKSAFYCFGCGKGGGLIQFVMDVEQLSFPEAVRMLAERAGVQLETEQRPAGAITRREYVELNRRLADTFRHVLRTSAEALWGCPTPGYWRCPARWRRVPFPKCGKWRITTPSGLPRC